MEVFIFLAAVAAFIFAIRFFVDSRKRLGEAFPDIFRSQRWLPFGVDRNGFLLPKKPKKGAAAPPFQRTQRQSQPAVTKADPNGLRVHVPQPLFDEPLEQAVSHNQKAENNTAPTLNAHNGWEEASLEAKQNNLFSQKLQERLGEMQEAFDSLQTKVQKMERQAWHSAELAAQLEQAEAAQPQLETTLLKKEDRVRELTQENGQLHDLLKGLEEKLSQSNRQQQQLLKKVTFLENINADLQQTAEAGKNLKARISRVAELESMIELMSVRR